MSDTSKTKKDTSQASLLNTLTNADKDPNKETSGTIIEYSREPVDKTPFWIVGNNEEGYIVTMGKLRVSQDKYKTIDDAKDAIYERDWQIIFNMVVSIIQMDEERKQKPNGE